MGKQSKRKRNKSKVHVKVKRHHIDQANDRLRAMYNERFGAHIPSSGGVRESDGHEMEEAEFLDKMTEIVDFYKASVIPPEGMRGEDGTVNPVDVAFNQLCEKGTQYTINHAHDNKVSSDAMNRLNMRALFGLQLKEDEEVEFEEEIKEGEEQGTDHLAVDSDSDDCFG